jgi:hypothetical protein
MSDEPVDNAEAIDDAVDTTVAARELVLALNFVPDWARKPPSASTYFQHDDRGGPRRDRGDRNDRGPRRDGGPRRPGGPPDRRREGGPNRHGATADRPQRSTYEPPRREAPIPFEIRFLPDERQLAGLVKRMRASRRAYPLPELVSLFLSNPDACRVKLEATSAEHRLWQCQACGMVALDRPAMEEHLMREHFGEAFETETRTIEPPTGNFVCVARCGLSGTLIGPPNHNTYASRVEELHRTRFAHMPLLEYRRHIETVHDAALIDQWKEECRTVTLYRRKGAPAEADAMKWSAAVDLFLREFAPDMMRLATHASLPAPLARRAQDARLTQALAAAWNRECRSPRALPIALQGALRGRHFHTFRAGEGVRFVTAIPPAPLDPARAIESIRAVLTFLRESPGCTRAQLLETLRPGIAPDRPEAAEILSPLSWLIERGHIIEFYNGTLSVPLR